MCFVSLSVEHMVCGHFCFALADKGAADAATHGMWTHDVGVCGVTGVCIFGRGRPD